mgnify:FL=1
MRKMAFGRQVDFVRLLNGKAGLRSCEFRFAVLK